MIDGPTQIRLSPGMPAIPGCCWWFCKSHALPSSLCTQNAFLPDLPFDQSLHILQSLYPPGFCPHSLTRLNQGNSVLPHPGTRGAAGVGWGCAHSCPLLEVTLYCSFLSPAPSQLLANRTSSINHNFSVRLRILFPVLWGNFCHRRKGQHGQEQNFRFLLSRLGKCVAARAAGGLCGKRESKIA